MTIGCQQTLINSLVAYGIIGDVRIELDPGVDAARPAILYTIAKTQRLDRDR